jgi:hypothetical protein
MTINITLNVNKITKEKIQPRKYTDKDGVEHTNKELKVKLVPLKEKKFITAKDDWTMYKTHFVVEEKLNKIDEQEKDVFIGDGFTFEKETEITPSQVENKMAGVEYPEEDINPEDIPF